MKRIVFITFLLCAALASNAEKYKVILNLEKGKEYIQKTESNMVINQNFNGMSIDINLNTIGNSIFKVNEVHPNFYWIDVKYTRLTMEMKMPQGNMKYDSKEPDPNDIMSNLLSKMLKQSFQIKMSKTGKVLEIKNLDHLLESIFEGHKLPQDQKDQIMSQIKQSYGKDSFIRNFETFSAIYPPKKINLNEKWAVKSKLTGNVHGDLHVDYQLKENQKDYYIIQGKGNLKADKNAPYLKQNGMEIQTVLSGSYTSNLKIDKKTGWIINGKVIQDYEGTNQMKANANLPNGMNIPIKMKTTTDVTN